MERQNLRMCGDLGNRFTGCSFASYKIKMSSTCGKGKASKGTEFRGDCQRMVNIRVFTALGGVISLCHVQIGMFKNKLCVTSFLYFLEYTYPLVDEGLHCIIFFLLKNFSFAQ